MKTVFFSRLIFQNIPHSSCRLLGQFPAEVIIDLAHDLDGIAANLTIINVTETFRRQLIALREEGLHGVGPVLPGIVTNLYRINLVTEYAAQNRDQTGD